VLKSACSNQVETQIQFEFFIEGSLIYSKAHTQPFLAYNVLAQKKLKQFNDFIQTVLENVSPYVLNIQTEFGISFNSGFSFEVKPKEQFKLHAETLNYSVLCRINDEANSLNSDAVIVEI